eukprot:8229580-Alexandrium_andersonii.AAC.1
MARMSGWKPSPESVRRPDSLAVDVNMVRMSGCRPSPESVRMLSTDSPATDIVLGTRRQGGLSLIHISEPTRLALI